VADLADAVEALAGPDRVDARPSSMEAMARALDLAGVDGGVLVTGSITLVAEVMENET
jgi:folylpolyglutamate synthase/dihydropteroate synthase